MTYDNKNPDNTPNQRICIEVSPGVKLSIIQGRGTYSTPNMSCEVAVLRNGEVEEPYAGCRGIELADIINTLLKENQA